MTSGSQGGRPARLPGAPWSQQAHLALSCGSRVVSEGPHVVVLA